MFDNQMNDLFNCANSDMQRTCTSKLLLKDQERVFRASICICCLPFISDYLEVVQYLHPQELRYFETLTFEKRKRSYLLGRYSAKHALSILTGETNLWDVHIKQGIFNHPIVINKKNQNIQVSISHCDNIGAAVAFPESLPMGIDIEQIDFNKNNLLELPITEKEKELIKTLPFSNSIMLIVLWTAKEALSKILKTGMATPFQVYEINQLKIKHSYIVSYFKQFIQYNSISFILGCYVCTIVYPRSTEISFNGNVSI
ncbi:4'-phosphopantetheinyl transferase superfamily protein [Desulfoscipio sp. XC116]|uniref:4'-phosphopantetheinyl transferase family protein n=1 Tax=Desulfoscipio sp. XC116 TaxID=3144975 RepID=UPI00325AAF30